MRRYSQVFVVVALFCFLFPFIVISPVKNASVHQMTGWEMLTTQDIGLSKQTPVVLHIPLRPPVLLALLCGSIAVLVMLARRKDATWIAVAGTIVAAISLWMATASSFPIQVTDGHTVLYNFENPDHQILPAFYVSLALMSAAAVSALLGLRNQSGLPVGSTVMAPPARASATAASQTSSVPPASFCIHCGGGLASGARFCNRCGAPVVAAPVLTKPVEASVPAANQAPAVAATAVQTPPVISSPTEVAAVSPPVSRPVPVYQPAVPTSVRSSPVPRFSFASKLGLATVGVVLAVAVWFFLHSTTDSRASIGIPTSVSISPANIRVAPGGTVRLQALVSGGRDSEVQWSIAEGTSGGTIEPGGATVQNGTVFLQANYRAPFLTGVYHVVAVSAADPTRKATAQVVVEYSSWR